MAAEPDFIFYHENAHDYSANAKGHLRRQCHTTIGLTKFKKPPRFRDPAKVTGLLLSGSQQIDRVECRDDLAADDELLEIVVILERLVIQKTQPKLSAIGFCLQAIEG